MRVTYKDCRYKKTYKTEIGDAYTFDRRNGYILVWKIRKGSKIYYFDPNVKIFYIMSFSGLQINGWSYSWKDI
jgi:hypothetical protein